MTEEFIPEIDVPVSWAELPSTPFGRMVFDSGSTWQLTFQDGTYFFWFISPPFSPQPYKLMTLKQESLEGEIRFHRPFFLDRKSVNPLGGAADQLLIGNLLGRGKGVHIHAAGIRDPRGRGCLFVGQSEAGKSTMARLWQDEPGVLILNDDRIILREQEGRLWMHGTPWHGEGGFSSPARAALDAVFLLRKGNKTELSPLRAAECAARLMSCAFVPFYSTPALSFTLEFLHKVAETAPCHELRFLPDKRAVKFIQNSVP
jgi:hypothetical protein